jgi:hypothetical protein
MRRRSNISTSEFSLPSAQVLGYLRHYRKMAEASTATESLRKDVNVMAEWIERIYEHLDTSPEPAAASTKEGHLRICGA